MELSDEAFLSQIIRLCSAKAGRFPTAEEHQLLMGEMLRDFTEYRQLPHNQGISRSQLLATWRKEMEPGIMAFLRGEMPQ